MVLLALGLGSGQLKLKAHVLFPCAGALVVLLIATQLALRGLAAFGIMQHLRFGEVVIW